MPCLVSTTTLKWCSTFRTITEGEGPPVDSTSIADMADFDDLFHSLGYTENDPNWTVPLMSDQEIVETIMLDREDSNL